MTHIEEGKWELGIEYSNPSARATADGHVVISLQCELSKSDARARLATVKKPGHIRFEVYHGEKSSERHPDPFSHTASIRVVHNFGDVVILQNVDGTVPVKVEPHSPENT